MSKAVLIVLKDKDMGELIAQLLEDDLPDEFDVSTVVRRTREEAEKQIRKKARTQKGSFDLIISDFRFPAAETREEVREGLESIRKIADVGGKVPIILISHIFTNSLSNALGGFFDCRLIVQEKKAGIDGGDFMSGLLDACQVVLKKEGDGRIDHPGNRKPAEPNENAVVTIILNIDTRTRKTYTDWQYTILSENVDEQRSHRAEGFLAIRTPKIEELIEDSETFLKKLKNNDVDGWEHQLEKIGKAIYEEIFQENFKFTKDFHILMGKITRPENIKICLKIQQTLPPVHLEAMFEHDEQKSQRTGFMMLESPIYRQIPVEGEYNTPTFDKKSRKEGINCLIIKSAFDDTIGFKKDFHDQEAPPAFLKKFPTLENLTAEAQNIYRILHENRKNFRINSIKVLDCDDRAPDFETLGFDPVEKGDWILSEKENFYGLVQETLKDKWHMVHYAGHSYYHSDWKTGYFILPGNFAVPAREFCAMLKDSRTQFLFLCSCDSSREDIVFEVVKRAVPSVIGFRWDLPDLLAAAYATKFYEYLVENRKTLELAFLSAQKKMYKNHKQSPIWAAPMLVMQCG